MTTKRTAAQQVGRLESTLEAVADAAGYHLWLAERLAAHLEQPVLEIGAGLGTLSNALSSFVGDVMASEPDPVFEDELQARSWPRVELAPALALPLPHAECWNSALPAPHTIVMSNVLEHIEDDVEALRSIATGLASVKRIVIVVPAHQWAYSPLDRDLGHHRRYSRTNLIETISSAGWEPTTTSYFNPLGALAWGMGRLLRRNSISPWQTRAVERALPLFKAIDRLAGGRLIGQSLIAVAVRPE